MLKISVQHNIKQLIAGLTNVQREQVPFATALALTRTAQVMKAAQITEMQRVFDRPTPFTLNSLFVYPATKKRLWASVYFKDFAPKGTPAGKYLLPQVQGGGRRMKRTERALQRKGLLPSGMYVVPGKGAQLDAHGNMSSGQIVKILSYLQAFGEEGYVANRRRGSKGRGKRRAEHYFVAAPGNAPLGVWQRKGTGIVPVLIFVRPPTYRARYAFEAVGRRIIETHFGVEFGRALMQALATDRNRTAAAPRLAA